MNIIITIGFMVLISTYVFVISKNLSYARDTVSLIENKKIKDYINQGLLHYAIAYLKSNKFESDFIILSNINGLPGQVTITRNKDDIFDIAVLGENPAYSSVALEADKNSYKVLSWG